MSTRAKELREEMLRLVEEDREFRYALMGLLSFKEILDRITRLEERFARLEERFAELEERQQKLEERQLKLEERQQKLEERLAKLEERFVELEERFAKLEERFAELEKRVISLEERFAQLEERVIRVEEELRDFRRTVTVIAHRFGILTEKSFREAMKYVVEEVLGVARVERWVHRDEEGLVYGYSSIVEVDVAIRDREHILVEVKSRVTKGDVAELHRKALLYEKVVGVKPRALIIGGFVDPQAYEAAVKLGVEIRPIIEQP